jgi:23S rRNA-/tRNA-specific pseudouridylate synthase
VLEDRILFVDAEAIVIDKPAGFRSTGRGAAATASPTGSAS